MGRYLAWSGAILFIFVTGTSESWGRGHELAFSGTYVLVEEQPNAFNLWGSDVNVTDATTHDTKGKGLVVDYRYEFHKVIGLKIGFGTWKVGSKTTQLISPFLPSPDFGTAETELKGRHLDVGVYFFTRIGRWKPYIGGGIVQIRIEMNTKYIFTTAAKSNLFTLQDADMRARGSSNGFKYYGGFSYEFGPQWGLNFEAGMMNNSIDTFTHTQDFSYDSSGASTQPNGSDVRKATGLFTPGTEKAKFDTKATYVTAGLNFRF